MAQPEREFGSLSNAELSQRVAETKQQIHVNRRSYKELAHWDGDRPGLAEAVGRHEAELAKLSAEVELRRIEMID